MGYELFYPYKLTSIRLDPWGGSFVIHLMGKLRRFYLVYFRKEYVKKQLASRKGECLQCAQCCSFVFVCPMLTRRSTCRTYNKFRLEMCKSFPIDQRDIDEVARRGGTCGYRFEKQSFHRPPSHSTQRNLLKQIEDLPGATTGCLLGWVDNSITQLLFAPSLYPIRHPRSPIKKCEIL